MSVVFVRSEKRVMRREGTYPKENRAKENPWAKSSISRFVIHSISWLCRCDWLNHCSCCGRVH